MLKDKWAAWLVSDNAAEGAFVNLYGTDEQGTTRRETVAELLNESEAIQLTTIINQLGGRFLPNC